MAIATGAAAKSPKAKAKDAPPTPEEELHEAAKDLLFVMDHAGAVAVWINDAKVGAAMLRLKAAVIATTLPPTVVDVPHAWQEGDMLTCTQGNWTGEPDSKSYQWKCDGADVPGASGATYTVVAGDVGRTFACVVTASNVAGQATSTSNAIVATGATGAMVGASRR